MSIAGAIKQVETEIERETNIYEKRIHDLKDEITRLRCCIPTHLRSSNESDYLKMLALRIEERVNNRSTSQDLKDVARDTALALWQIDITLESLRQKE